MEKPTGYEAPSLKDICLKVIHIDLISKATPGTVEHVRDGIDNWERVIKGRRGEKDYRQECLEKLNGSYFTEVLDGPEGEHVLLHVSAVLDCLLTGNLTVLELHMPYQSIKFFSSLMTVIARRSPKLKDLVIKLYSHSPLLEEPLLKMKESYNSSIYLLHDLTSLSLHYEESGSIRPPLRFADEPSCQSILSTVGERCPTLEKLFVRGFRFRKQDLLGLILGEVADVLFPLDNEGWSEDTVLGSLWVPQEFMRPSCFTLQDFLVICLCKDSAECTHRSFSPAVYAFVLRHLRNLDCNLFLGSRCFPAVISPQLLEALKKERLEFQQTGFEEACLTALATCVGLKRNVTGPLSYISDGSISLRFLRWPNGVPIDDPGMMRDIGNAFPNATEVSFSGNVSYNGRTNLTAHLSTAEHSSLFNDDIDATLGECWPNVKSVYFMDVSCRACVKTILTILGPKLKMIYFRCSELDLLDLIPCTNLERLTIGANCSIVTNPTGSLQIDRLISLPFLPALKEFTSYSCLRNWSRLFESKSSLSELRLNCSHIGIGELPRLEWSQIPELWKTVETLDIGSCSGLPLTDLAEHFSQLTSLKNSSMPDFITKNETKEYIDEVLQRLLDSQKSVDFNPEYYWNGCDFQPQ